MHSSYLQSYLNHFRDIIFELTSEISTYPVWQANRLVY